MNKAKLIINADDFGLSMGVSNGILTLLQSNKISDISLLPVGEAFSHSVNLLKNANIKNIGVHLCAVDSETPLESNAEIILQNGKFHKKRNILFINAFTNPKKVQNELKKEFKLQIQKVLDEGFTITHIDSHQHIHLFPLFHDLYIDLIREFKIPCARIPKADKFGLVPLAVNYFTRHLSRALTKNEVKFANFLGFKTSGNLDSNSLLSYLRHLKPGKTYELMAHPGIIDEKTNLKYKHWNYSWIQEFEAFQKLDPSFFEKNNIELISFADL